MEFRAVLLCCLTIVCGVEPQGATVCQPKTYSNASQAIGYTEAFSEKLCQIDRLEHVSSWMRNKTDFTGVVGHTKGRGAVTYFPNEGVFTKRWPGLLSPCDAEWLGLLTVEKATRTDLLVDGPSYKGKVFVERPTFDGYKAWACGKGKSFSRSGVFCSTDSTKSSELITGDKVIWVGDVICQRGTPIPTDVFNELHSLSQSEFPDLCKVDGIKFNDCEHESVSESFDVTWMDVGGNHKILMREHYTKWIQESTPKDFICFGKDGTTCSKEGEDKCYKQGKCTGDKYFCNIADCTATSSDTETECHCELTNKPGALTVVFNGLSVRPKCYGFSRMMVTRLLQKEVKHQSDCSGCHIECIEGGVNIITLTSELHSATVCAGQFCAASGVGKKRTKVLFHEGALVGDHIININGRLADGTRFQLKGNCKFPDGCDAVSCTFCSEFLKNPQCYPVRKWVFILIVLLCSYCLLMLVANILRAISVWWAWVKFPMCIFIKITSKIFRSLSGRVKRVKERLELEDVAHNNAPALRDNQPLRRQRMAAFYPSIIMLMCIMAQSEACDELVHAQSSLLNCKRGTGNVKECTANGKALLPAVNPGQTACLHFSSPESPESKCLKIRVKSINLKCKQGSTYYVPEAKARCTSVRRCRWAGDCQAGCPSNFGQNSFSGDWTGRMERSGLGMSGCSDGCGGAACGCFNAAPSCVFWRKWVENPNGQVWRVSPCLSWSLATSVELELPSGEVRTFNPLHGVSTQIFKGVSITYLGSSSSTISVPDVCELEDMVTGKLALSPCSSPGALIMGKIGEIQCSSYEGAKKIKTGDCSWMDQLVGMELRVDDAVCFSRITSTESVANFSRVPTTIAGIRYEESPHEKGKILGSPLDITNVQGSFSVTFRGLKLTLSEQMATCSGEFLNLTGCYSCMSGANLRIKLHSSKNTTAHLVCKSDETAFHAIEGVKEYKVGMSFSNAVVQEECILNCGGQKSKIGIYGNLVFMGIPKFVNGSYITTFHSQVPQGASMPNPKDWLGALFGNGIARWILGAIGVVILSLILFLILYLIAMRLLNYCKGHSKLL